MRTNCWSYADTRKHAVGRSRGKQSIRTLYLDWEWDQGEHRLRLEQMFGDMPRGLFYWRCDRPLAQLGDAIRRVVRRNRIEYLVVDSIAYACGHAPEAADTAANYKRAVDRLAGSAPARYPHRVESGWNGGARADLC